jgi:23S rRNA pseudoU1915 N3-methylase RlmH
MKAQQTSYEKQLKEIEAINKTKDETIKKITAEYAKKFADLAKQHAKDLAAAKKKKASTQAAYAKLPPSELTKKLASEFDLQVVP